MLVKSYSHIITYTRHQNQATGAFVHALCAFQNGRVGQAGCQRGCTNKRENPFKDFHERLMARGKKFKVAIIAVMRKDGDCPEYHDQNENKMEGKDRHVKKRKKRE
jgi:hypothetical protein